jgi:hypothetical protein
MINHYRTVLLNIQGSNWPGLSYPGEELVDPLFYPSNIPNYASTVYRLIFGEKPDRAYLNYRLRQLTTMWHDGILHSTTTEKDSRLTYWPLKFAAGMNEYGKVKVETINGDAVPDYVVLTTPHADDRSGKAQFLYDLTISENSCYVVDEVSKNEYEIASSGAYLDLGYNLRIGVQKGHFRLEAIGIPQKDIGQILVDCERIIGSVTELELFTGKEDLKRLWRTSEFISERMGALSLALAISIDGIGRIKIL